MDVSIVTPVLNEPRLEATLSSIGAQEGPDRIESIIVDGGSTDRTIDVIERFRDRIDVLIREPDDGVYDAMNKGIRRATGDVVGILNADDRYQDADVLEEVTDTFSNRDVDACYGDLVMVDADDEVVRYWKSGPFSSRRFYFGWMPPHPTFFARREVYERFDPFDPSFAIAADYELLLRLLVKHGISVSYIERTLVRMAIGGQSNASIRNVVSANLEVYRAWQKNDLRGGFAAPILKPLRKIPQYVTGTS